MANGTDPAVHFFGNLIHGGAKYLLLERAWIEWFPVELKLDHD